MKKDRTVEALCIHPWGIPLLELDISTKLVQNIKLAEVATGIGKENVRKLRLPLSGEERNHGFHVIFEGLKSRPTLPEYKSLKVVFYC